jgi:putative transcriptional regulator
MNDLSDTFLVAAPKLDDARFIQSVVYMYKHNIDGAVGFIINKPVNKSLWIELCRTAGITNPVEKDIPIYFGGPVDSQVGFVLHTTDYKTMLTESINEWLSITQGIDVLIDIAQGNGPRNFQITLGYSGWNPGQLELELESQRPRDPNSGWMNIPASETLIFDIGNENKWERAIDSYATTYVDDLLKFKPHERTNKI